VFDDVDDGGVWEFGLVGGVCFFDAEYFVGDGVLEVV
jgi:hypothetical protein